MPMPMSLLKVGLALVIWPLPTGYLAMRLLEREGGGAEMDLGLGAFAFLFGGASMALGGLILLCLGAAVLGSKFSEKRIRTYD